MEQLLDIIETEYKTHKGIIDYATTKHIIIFDFQEDTTGTLTQLAVAWKMSDVNIRFSVFCTLNFPNIDLPNAIMLNKKAITNIDYDITPNTPKRRTFKVSR